MEMESSAAGGLRQRRPPPLLRPRRPSPSGGASPPPPPPPPPPPGWWLSGLVSGAVRLLSSVLGDDDDDSGSTASGHSASSSSPTSPRPPPARADGFHGANVATQSMDEDVDFTEETGVTASEEVLQTAHKAVDEEGVMAADEMKNKADVSVEEEAVLATDEMPQSMDEDVDFTEKTGVTASEEVLQTAHKAVDEEGVMAADEMQFTSATMNKSVEEVVTFDNLSQARLTDDECAVEDSACTPVVDTARDFSDHIASPLFANGRPTDNEWAVNSDSVGEKKASEPVAVERENESEALGSLRKENEEKEGEKSSVSLDKLSLRKLKLRLKETLNAQKVTKTLKRKVAVIQGNEANDMPLCIFSDSVGEKKASEPVVVERENESEALGSLRLRKLRPEFNQIVAVAQDNEEKEGEKSSVPLDKFSLRKLKLRLKETLNAQKNREPTRVPLGRLQQQTSYICT